MFEAARVIPVLILDDPSDAVPVADALVEGGLNVLEVTLRTEAAWAALTAIIDRHPAAVVGVGTVLDGGQIKRAKRVGASFAVSPGFSSVLSEMARSRDLFYLPGVATASEIMQARYAGHRFLKFFPAEASGGIPLLKSFASPFQDIVFFPTGGIGPANSSDYLAQPNVACVGGSWVASAADIRQNDWAAITAKAKATKP
ncbi:MAG: bifunctional 4-hydroxy-2-oxoglutarate aldolase/2-dehydro-3-deoxy-phosphogluconate aldolase [Pseudomonadota bacterium]|nr:bifunctional 4-hydroxy-2-oxoglutarate aldolase/2-dehydro-3-deoxy-phosphogluconate aldolase [Pseudomonadota bacterium]